MLLEGKVAVITGGGSGIGRAIALAYAQEGARLVLASPESEMSLLEETRERIESYGSEALIVPTDIRDEERVQVLAVKALEHYEQVDILVNNSGVEGPTAPLWEVALREWEETLKVNLTGTYLCCRAFLPHMIERRTGSIIMIGSGTGKKPLVGRTPYAASKLGLVALVRTLAIETGAYNVRVNLISPGLVEGERIERVLQKQAKMRGISYEQARQYALRDTPLGRFVPASDIAQAAIFLASSLAASITGEDLNVSAGTIMY